MTLMARSAQLISQQTEPTTDMVSDGTSIQTSPRAYICESARRGVLDLLRRGGVGTINLDTAPPAGIAFVTALGFEACFPFENSSIQPLITMLSTGRLPARYFCPQGNWFEQRAHAPRVLVTVEGSVPPELIAPGVVLGPGPFLNRLHTGHAFMIEHITQITIRETRGSQRLEQHRKALEHAVQLLDAHSEGR